MKQLFRKGFGESQMQAYCSPLLSMTHMPTIKGHCVIQFIVDAARRVWYECGTYSEAAKVARKCQTYQVNNISSRKIICEGGRLWAQHPFEKLQLDFIQLPRTNGFQYALRCWDQLTHWVETFPCCHATAIETARHLLK